jgi:hypothetical protein
MSATLLIEATISVSEPPARLTRSTPSCACAPEIGDQVLDVFRRLRRALREASHLGGHHRKTAAGVARACGLNRGIPISQAKLVIKD